MPCKCNKKVERYEQHKVQCGDCKEYLHTKCVNLLDRDIDFMKRNNRKYRCDQCAAYRRKSLHLDQTQQSTGVTKSVEVANSPQVDFTCSSDSVDVTLNLVYREVLELKKVNASALSLISELQNEKIQLQQRVNQLEVRVNDLEQSKRKKIIEITGIPNLSNDNAVDKCLKIFSAGIGVTVAKEQIDYYYIKRIKRKIEENASNNIVSSAEASTVRDIVCVKFISQKLKQNIMSKKFANKSKLTTTIFGEEHSNSNVYVNESLTSHTRALLKAARDIKNTKRYKYLWVRNASILLRKKDGDQAIMIKSYEDLEKL